MMKYGLCRGEAMMCSNVDAFNGNDGPKSGEENLVQPPPPRGWHQHHGEILMSAVYR